MLVPFRCTTPACREALTGSAHQVNGLRAARPTTPGDHDAEVSGAQAPCAVARTSSTRTARRRHGIAEAARRATDVAERDDLVRRAARARAGRAASSARTAHLRPSPVAPPTKERKV